LFANTFSLFSCLNVRNQVLHPYGITCKIIVMYDVRQFNSRNCRSILLGRWLGKLVYLFMFGHLHELQSKCAIPFQAEKAVRVHGIPLMKNEWQESGVVNEHQVLCEDL
jgi:hypothetical protein